jgi:hypothetical protein
MQKRASEIYPTESELIKQVLYMSCNNSDWQVQNLNPYTTAEKLMSVSSFAHIPQYMIIHIVKAISYNAELNLHVGH